MLWCRWKLKHHRLKPGGIHGVREALCRLKLKHHWLKPSGIQSETMPLGVSGNERPPAKAAWYCGVGLGFLLRLISNDQFFHRYAVAPLSHEALLRCVAQRILAILAEESSIS